MADVALTVYGHISTAVVNVVDDHGADKTGTNLATTPFQDAIATGKHVFIPPGNYRIDDVLTLNTAGQQVFTSFYTFGFGNAPVVIEFENTTGVCFALEADSVGIGGFEISQTGVPTAGAHVVIGDGTGPAGIRRPTVRNIRTTGGYVGIKAQTYAWASLIADLSIWNPIQYGIWVNSAIPYGGNIYSRIHIRGDGTGPAGIYIDQADYNEFDNITIGGTSAFTEALIHLNSTSNKVIQQQFSHIYLDSIPAGAYGIKLENGGNTNRTHSFNNVNINTALGAGAYIGADVEQVSISNFQANYISTGYNGIDVYGDETALHNIKIGNADTGNSTSSDGIVVYSGADGTKITGSRIMNCRYGIDLQAGSSHNVVIGNNTLGNNSSGLNVGAGVDTTAIGYNL